MRILGLCILLSLASCASKPEMVEVFVPVYRELVIPEVNRPILFTEQLTEDDKKVDGRLVQAYALTLQQLILYTEELETILEFVREQNRDYVRQ